MSLAMAISSIPITRGAGSRTAELLGHVLLVQFLDGVPIEEQFLGHLLDGVSRQRRPTKKANRLVYSGLSASQSSRSRFTPPHRGQSTRRTESAR